MIVNLVSACRPIRMCVRLTKHLTGEAIKCQYTSISVQLVRTSTRSARGSTLRRVRSVRTVASGPGASSTRHRSCLRAAVSILRTVGKPKQRPNLRAARSPVRNQRPNLPARSQVRTVRKRRRVRIPEAKTPKRPPPANFLSHAGRAPAGHPRHSCRQE